MKSPSRLSRRKRVAFALIILLLLYAFLEVASFVACRVHYGRWYTWSSAADQRRRAAEISPGSTPDFSFGVIHPYVGYVEPLGWNPDNPDFKYPFLWADDFTNDPFDGFRSRHHVVQHRSPGVAIVGIFGGSVAEIYHRQGIHITLQKLREHPEYRNKKFVVVCLADGGYKQPQQLMALNYILAQGGQLDFIINIDGFNEVALHAAENAKQDVFPLFPRAWFSRAGEFGDPEILRLFGRRALAETAIRDSAHLFSTRPWSWSPFCHLLWRARSHLLDKRLHETVTAIDNHHAGKSFAGTGPAYGPATDEQLYRDLVRYWEESSRQMHAVCLANRIRYYHFLQPNQYVKGSKELDESELKNAYLEDHPYRPGVNCGYPLLREAGQRLAASGVRFLDLTDVFKTTKEPIYVDTCCHMNERGNEIIALRIAESIVDDLNRE